METKFTPGPLKAMNIKLQFYDGVRTCGTVYLDGTDIATARCAKYEDAVLYATAPDMYEALCVAEAELENHVGVPGVLEHVLPCIRAALTKATGGAP